MTETRRYQLKERAKRQEQTRRRITEAAIALHEEVGPAATAISEIARRAGVQRLTVYKHFPDDFALLEACASHWNAAHPLPDPERWREIDGADARTRSALRDLYAYYADNRQMLANVIRDSQVMPAVRTQAEQFFGPYLEEVVPLLIGPWKLRGRRRDLVAAQLDLVMRFDGWQVLVERTGDARRAADLAADLVREAAA